MITRERIEVLASEPAAGHRIGAPPTDAEVRELAGIALLEALVLEVTVEAGMVALVVSGPGSMFTVRIPPTNARRVAADLNSQADWLEHPNRGQSMAELFAERMREREAEGR